MVQFHQDSPPVSTALSVVFSTLPISQSFENTGRNLLTIYGKHFGQNLLTNTYWFPTPAPHFLLPSLFS